MKQVLLYALCAVIGYALGCVSTGVIVSKLYGRIDIRNYGSGNAGMTNVMRTLGWVPSFLTFAGDALKGVLGALIGHAYRRHLRDSRAQLAGAVPLPRRQGHEHLVRLYSGGRLAHRTGAAGHSGGCAADFRLYVACVDSFGVRVCRARVRVPQELGRDRRGDRYLRACAVFAPREYEAAGRGQRKPARLQENHAGFPKNDEGAQKQEEET